jgi:hypothetical protein
MAACHVVRSESYCSARVESGWHAWLNGDLFTCIEETAKEDLPRESMKHRSSLLDLKPPLQVVLLFQDKFSRSTLTLPAHLLEGFDSSLVASRCKIAC